MNKNDSRWVSVAEAAELLGVHPDTVRARIASGEIPAYRSGPRLIRILAVDLEQSPRRIPTAGGVA